MKRLLGEITWDNKKQVNDQKKENIEITVGISFRGLEALNVPDGYLHIFRHLAPAFAQGAGVRAAEHLGDVGSSAARYWDATFGLDSVHAILTIHGTPKTAKEIHDWYKPPIISRLRKGLTKVSVTYRMEGKHLKPPTDKNANDPWHDPKEELFYKTAPKPDGSTSVSSSSPVWVHFGYRDGLTSNHIQTQQNPNSAKNVHEPGELLLGELRNTGDNPWSLIDRKDRVRGFFKHSSFGVLRRVEQDERRFRTQVKTWVDVLNRNLEWGESSNLTSFIRAKLCGRWPNGQVVRRGDSSVEQSERKIETNNFHYGNENEKEKKNNESITLGPDYKLEENDTSGLGCPFSSHIRRMNPRNENGIQTRQRPLFRRGMPYGPWYRDDEEDGMERGLIGLFFCSDLQDQFEHLLGEWADRSPLGIDGDRNQKDPLIGTHTNSQSKFTITHQTQETGKDINHSIDLWGFKSFVRTRGTAYCFYPSYAALEELGKEKWVEQEDEQWLAR